MEHLLVKRQGSISDAQQTTRQAGRLRHLHELFTPEEKDLVVSAATRAMDELAP
jgi:hypothetical protein